MTIFFDFNGTILDDLDLCLRLLNELLEEEGHEKVTLEKYLDIFTFPIIEYYKLAGFDFKKTSFDDLAVRYIKRYQPQSLLEKIHEGLVETVNELKSLGHRVVVLSASKQQNLDAQMKHFGIYDLFDDVLGTSDIYASSKINVALEYVKEKKINNNDIIVVGDTLHDKEVGDALGAKTILYSKGHQAKYRFKNFKVIDNYNQLIKGINSYEQE